LRSWLARGQTPTEEGRIRIGVKDPWMFPGEQKPTGDGLPGSWMMPAHGGRMKIASDIRERRQLARVRGEGGDASRAQALERSH